MEELRFAFRARVPTVIWGPPGVGKTASIEALAREMGVPLIVPQVRAPEDIALPVFVGDRVRVLPVEEFARAAATPDGIVFVDEITTLSPAVQAAVLRFLDSGVVGGVRIPGSVWRVAAGNPPELAAGGWDLAPPTANRLLHLDFELKPAEWAERFVGYWGAPPVLAEVQECYWARARALVAGFIRCRPDLLLKVPESEAQRGKAWPSPRSWDNSSRVIGAVLAAGLEVKEAVPLVAGAVGEGPALEFAAWVQALDLVDPEELLADPQSLRLPARGDQAYVLLAGVAAVACDSLKRWTAGWEVMMRAAELGAPDIAAAAARVLVQGRRPGWLPPVRVSRVFKPLLDEK